MLRNQWVFSIFVLYNLIFISQALATSLSDTLIYSSDALRINGQSSITGGAVVSDHKITLGVNTSVTGHIWGAEDLLLTKNAVISGDVELGGSLILGPNARVSGAVIENSVNLPAFTIPTNLSTPSTTDFAVADGSTDTLASGAYNEILVGFGSTLTLSGGVYDCQKLIAKPGAQIEISAPTIIRIADSFHFLHHSRVVFSNTTLLPSDLTLFVEGLNPSFLGWATDFSGIINILNTPLIVRKEAKVWGSLRAKNIYIEEQVEIEWAADCVSAVEICEDGFDQDCDGQDEVCAVVDPDDDFDGYTKGDGDCNDADANIFPSAAEVCDGIDNNCDSQSDENLAFATYYLDADGDGSGDAHVSVTSCATVTGHVDQSGDCNDNDPLVSPLVLETCDGIDNNCDGQSDENLSDCLNGVVVDLPNDPIAVASEIPASQAYTLSESATFLYEGSDPIQTDVVTSELDDSRLAVVRGVVYDTTGATLPLVTITILDHDEFGETQTRADGEFDIVVNGGGDLVVVYMKDGYLPVQRQIKVKTQSFAIADDVVMTALDTNVTTLNVNDANMQVATSSVQTDDDGTRQAKILMPAQTTATMTLSDGTTQALSTTMNLRTTEFTVGDLGMNAMPGNLPVNSAYTYAANITLDEALSAGATRVDFNQPIYYYVENFLNFPVGSAVPTGYYDEAKAQWMASSNGVIVEILGDTDGDGKTELSFVATGTVADAATLASYNVSDDERTTLLSEYTQGTELWRVPMTHLTPWDHNWPYYFANSSVLPEISFDESLVDENLNNSCQTSGSIISCENQTLGENLPLVGTPFYLNYTSDRAPGRLSRYATTFQITPTDALPASLTDIIVQVNVAGQMHKERLGLLAPESTYTYAWDGLDAYGRVVGFSQKAQIKVGYEYQLVYAPAGTSTESFGDYTSSQVSLGGSNRTKGILWNEQEISLGAFDARYASLGGWTLNVQHTYNPLTHELHLGTGETITQDSIPHFVKTIAGTGVASSTGDAGFATLATLKNIESVAVGSDGSIYVGADYRIRKIDPQGIITTIAGTGSSTNSGDGGLATLAGLSAPTDLAIDREDNVYIVNYFTHTVRKIEATTGVITTVAGTGTAGFSGDEGLATLAQLNYPSAIAVDSKGQIYIADTSNVRIRKIDTNGIITTVAGNGRSRYNINSGVLAINTAFYPPRDIAVSPNDEIYFLSSQSPYSSIHKVLSDGSIQNVTESQYGIDYISDFSVNDRGAVFLAIGGTSLQKIYKLKSDGSREDYAGQGAFTQDYTVATDFKFSKIVDLIFNQQGIAYIADRSANKIFAVQSPFPAFDANDIYVASQDGDLIYHFNEAGQHLETHSAITGAILLTFGYDSENRLSTVTDADGLVTTFNRDAQGGLLNVVSPYAQTTNVTINSDGYIESISTPKGATFGMTYTNGLLTTFTNPVGSTSTFDYDPSTGKLIKDTNALLGFKELAYTGTADDFSVSVTTALGLAKSHAVTTNSDNTITRTHIGTNGLTTTVEYGNNGSTTTTSPEGMVMATTVEGDSRFGLQAPLTNSQTVTTPSGLELSITTDQTNVLSGADDFTLSTQTTTTNINGDEFVTVFDNTANTFTQTSAEGRVVSQTLDDVGRVLTTSLSGLDTVSYSYTSSGELDLITQGSRVVDYNYNTEGFLDSITDSLGQISYFDYDADGFVTTQTLSDGRELHYSYDDAGNLLSITHAAGGVHNFTYDILGQSDLYTPPDIGLSGNQTNTDYDLDGRLDLITKPSGETIDPEYNSLGQLQTLSFNRGAIEYAYSPTTGQIQTITDANGGTLDFTFDGNLPLSSTYTGDFTASVARTFNNTFQVITHSVNGGNTITLDYDSDGLLTQAGDADLTYYSTNGFLHTVTVNGLVTTYNYNTYGELESQTSTYAGNTLAGFTYIHDALGRITTKSETLGSLTNDWGYVYDTSGRLDIFKLNGVEYFDYTYDDNNNRLSSEYDSTTTTSATYDAQDRLLTYGANTYTYSNSGDLQTKTTGTDTTSYTYDTLGNLVRVNMPNGDVIEYTIDALNRRVGKSVNGTLIAGYVYDDQLRIVAELDSTGNVVSRFVYASRYNIPDYFEKNGITYAIVADQLGSPRLIVNTSDGSLTAEITYDDFGNEITNTNPGFIPFGFAGGFRDSDTGLIRFGARDYDPVTGRFTNKDPIGFNGGDANLYSYVGQDPVNYMDPFGLEKIRFKVITLIRPPDRQAGEKSSQTIVLDTDKHTLYQFSKTGHTILGGKKIPARRHTLTSKLSEVSSGTGCSNAYNISLNADVASWFVPVNINYEINIMYDPNSGTTTINGFHDGYPSYEIYKDDQKIYDYQQGSIFELIGSGDVQIGK